MKPELHQPPVDPNRYRFQKIKGFFIIDYDCVMTECQVVNVLETYTLVEFTDNYGIEQRDVMFWHALITDGYLKIIVYDINNHIIITRLYDISSSDCNWFIIDDNAFKKELLETETGSDYLN